MDSAFKVRGKSVPVGTVFVSRAFDANEGIAFRAWIRISAIGAVIANVVCVSLSDAMTAIMRLHNSPNGDDAAHTEDGNEFRCGGDTYLIPVANSSDWATAAIAIWREKTVRDVGSYGKVPDFAGDYFIDEIDYVSPRKGPQFDATKFATIAAIDAKIESENAILDKATAKHTERVNALLSHRATLVPLPVVPVTPARVVVSASNAKRDNPPSPVPNRRRRNK